MAPFHIRADLALCYTGPSLLYSAFARCIRARLTLTERKGDVRRCRDGVTFFTSLQRTAEV